MTPMSDDLDDVFELTEVVEEGDPSKMRAAGPASDRARGKLGEDDAVDFSLDDELDALFAEGLESDGKEAPAAPGRKDADDAFDLDDLVEEEMRKSGRPVSSEGLGEPDEIDLDDLVEQDMRQTGRAASDDLDLDDLGDLGELGDLGDLGDLDLESDLLGETSPASGQKAGQKTDQTSDHATDDLDMGSLDDLISSFDGSAKPTGLLDEPAPAQAAALTAEITALTARLAALEETLGARMATLENGAAERPEPTPQELQSVAALLQPGLTQSLRAELRPLLASELAPELGDMLRQRLQEDLRPAIAEELRPELETSLRETLEPGLEQALLPPLRGGLERELADSLKDSLRPILKDELKEDMRGELANELSLELQPEIQARMEELLADDSPMFTAFRDRLSEELTAGLAASLDDRVAEVLERRLDGLAERLTAGDAIQERLRPLFAEESGRLKEELGEALRQEIERQVPQAAARIIREEIAALTEDLAGDSEELS